MESMVQPSVTGRPKKCVELEVNVDNMTQDKVENIYQECSAIGVLDTWTSQVMLRGGKPGLAIHVLCFETKVDKVSNILYKWTSAHGMRYKHSIWYRFDRKPISREPATVTHSARVEAPPRPQPRASRTHAAALGRKGDHEEEDDSACKALRHVSSETRHEKQTKLPAYSVSPPPFPLRRTSSPDASVGSPELKPTKNEIQNVMAKLDELVELEKQEITKQRGNTKREEGNDWYKEKKYGMAIKCYTDALNICPTDTQAMCNRSNAFYSGRFYEESARDARNVIAMDPLWAKGYYRLAMALTNGRLEYAKGGYMEAMSTLATGIKVVKNGRKSLLSLRRKLKKATEALADESEDDNIEDDLEPAESPSPAFTGQVFETQPTEAPLIYKTESIVSSEKKRMSKFKQERSLLV